jgi:hypothetical protein
VDEELTSGVERVRRRFAELYERLQELISESEETAAWFAMWAPVVASAGRLAKTLGRVGFQLRDVASGESDAVWTEEDRAHVAAELATIAADFPDVADVIFGLENIDVMIDALLTDGDARRAASATVKSVTDLLDRLISRLIAIGLGQRETSFGPDRVVEFLERFEDSAETILNPWVQRALGVSLSEAKVERKRSDET